MTNVSPASFASAPYDGLSAANARSRAAACPDLDLLWLNVKLSAENGLRQVSQIAIDKMTTIPKQKIGVVARHVDNAVMLGVRPRHGLFL